MSIKKLALRRPSAHQPAVCPRAQRCPTADGASHLLRHTRHTHPATNWSVSWGSLEKSGWFRLPCEGWWHTAKSACDNPAEPRATPIQQILRDTCPGPSALTKRQDDPGQILSFLSPRASPRTPRPDYLPLPDSEVPSILPQNIPGLLTPAHPASGSQLTSCQPTSLECTKHLRLNHTAVSLALPC